MTDNVTYGSGRSIRQSLGEHRIYLLLAAVFGLMAYTAPNFLTWNNQTAIMKGMSLQALPAVGFAIVMICKQLDLSVGVCLTLGGMMTIAYQPQFGWGGGILIAMLAGAVVGLTNGFLVAKAKVDSFIATLGTMTITQGFIYKFSGGDTLAVQDFTLSDWMETPLMPLLSPRILIVVVLVLCFEFMLKRTRVGRGFYLVGGNATTAWYAGLPVDRYVMGAFILSGVLSALGGALFSISINSATTTMGTSSLMVIVAAVIIGGTHMTGGKGSVFKAMMALIALTMLSNGFSCMGAGWEIQKITSGFVLGSVILYDAWLVYREERLKGQRHELLDELERDEDIDESEQEGNLTMQKKTDHTVAIFAIAVVGCVAIVAIFAMYNLRLSQMATQATPQYMPAAAGNTASEQTSATEPIDIATIKSIDGQLLIPPGSPKEIPDRPKDPSALPEDDAGHWYDMEYAGWALKKTNIPESPGDGPRGKRIAHLKMVDHPYHTAFERGLRKIADAYGMEAKTMVANNDINIQAQQVEQAINEKVDLVIINPVDAKACLPLFRDLNKAGIPVIASNVLPSDEAMAYCLAWTGPDDWGQFRMLARDFAERMNYEGGYCIVRHYPGLSPYFARTFSIITELKKIAPKMKLLTMQTTDLEAEKSMQVVSDWITRFGDDLKGIVSADDSGTQVGINEAVHNAGREDIIRVAAGNSKVGMEFVQAGTLHAITYQSPEADGAIPMQMAADWFNGKEIEAIRYLPKRIITKETVAEYLPAQW